MADPLREQIRQAARVMRSSKSTPEEKLFANEVFWGVLNAICGDDVLNYLIQPEPKPVAIERDFEW